MTDTLLIICIILLLLCVCLLFILLAKKSKSGNFANGKTLDELKVGNAYTSYDATTYTEAVVYLESADKYTLFADYSPLETAVNKDAVDEETEEETEEEEENDTNVWLLGSSISIAVVLVVAIVSLIVRKAVSNNRKKRGVYPEKDKKNNK